MARSRFPFKVCAGGASNSALAWASLIAGVKPSLVSLRTGFEASDYAGVVTACESMVMTSAIADLCTRAACRTHDAANARLWLPINQAGQIGRLVNYCRELGNTAIRAPALDCSKDPLDCR